MRLSARDLQGSRALENWPRLATRSRYSRRASEIGGLVRSAIAPYRIERDPLPAEMRALEALGVRFQLDEPVACLDELTAYDAVFLGVGLGDDTDLALPGDDLDGVWESLRFVEALKNGEPT